MELRNSVKVNSVIRVQLEAYSGVSSLLSTQGVYRRLHMHETERFTVTLVRGPSEWFTSSQE